MADNVQITQGSGTSVATDDVGGVHHQRVKVEFGADGVATMAADSDGARLPVGGAAVGTPGAAAWSLTGDGSIISILKKLATQFAAGFTMSGSVGLTDAEGIKGQVGGIAANPTSTLTRPNNTDAYTGGDAVASSTTAPVVPSIAIARVAGGSFETARLRLRTNKTSGMGGVQVRVDLFTGGADGATPPTGANDNAAYSLGAGSAQYIGTFRGEFVQFSDGAAAILQIDGFPAVVDLAAGQACYWLLQAVTGFTPDANQTFTLTSEARQN